MQGRSNEEQQYRHERQADISHIGGKEHASAAFPAGGFRHEDDDDFRGVAENASRRAGDSGDAGLFGCILNALGERKGDIAAGDVDHESAVQHHQTYYGNGGDADHNEATSGGMGAAAAMQALKMFSSGESEGGKQDLGAFLGLALSEASKLFDQKTSQGKVGAGQNKESAIMQAGEMALKMYMQGKGQQTSGPGGMGGLLSMASKYMQ